MITRSLIFLVFCVLHSEAAPFGRNNVTNSHDDLVKRPGYAQAYVSLLYSDSFVLGLRVLGQSLRETGTERYAILDNKNIEGARDHLGPGNFKCSNCISDEKSAVNLA